MRKARNAFFPTKRERSIEKDCRLYALEKGFKLIKLTTGDGIPDRQLLGEPIAPEVVFFEMKKIGEYPTPKQELMHEDLRSQGYEVHVINEGFKQFKNIIDSYT